MNFAANELRLALNALAVAEADQEAAAQLLRLLDTGRQAEVAVQVGSLSVRVHMLATDSVHLLDLVQEMQEAFAVAAQRWRQQVATWRAELDLMDAEARRATEASQVQPAGKHNRPKNSAQAARLREPRRRTT